MTDIIALLFQLETFRIYNKLKPKDMAELLGIQSTSPDMAAQVYRNYRNEKKLPYKYHETAKKLLEEQAGFNFAKDIEEKHAIKRPQAAIIKKRLENIFEHAPDDKLDDIVDLLGALSRLLRP